MFPNALQAAESGLLGRRELLQKSFLGLGAIALEVLLADQARSAPAMESGFDTRPKPGQFAPQAKAVILMMQSGGPSQMDLFDPKPALNRLAGERYSGTVEKFQTGNSDDLLGSPFKFQKYGQCGMDFAEVLPHMASQADRWCMIRSMQSEHNDHTGALLLLNTGKIFPGRPALGSWVCYGLGSENQNLPAYVVLRDPAGYNTSGTLMWQNGWLPALYRGTEISTKGPPVLNLQSGNPLPAEVQTRNLKLLAELNEAHRRQYPTESDLEARIRNYELAARMQLAAHDLLDLSQENEATRRLYGLDNPVTAPYGLRCLMARRLVESGVRFVQVFPPAGQPWDAHKDVDKENRKVCSKTDQPSAALVTDLQRRGLLEETLVIWAGEFGRLPVSQNGKGRDHNRNAFTLLIAGAGFKRGYIHGETDDVGYKVARDGVKVSDLHATILHQLGIDHTQLVFPHHGSSETLTDKRVSNARVVAELLDKPPTVC